MINLYAHYAKGFTVPNYRAVWYYSEFILKVSVKSE